LFPISPRRHHPLVGRLRKQMSAGAIGNVRYLRLERTVSRTDEPRTEARLSSTAVETALMDDLDLLRSIGGDYSRVTTLYSGEEPDRILRASVTLAGDRLPEADWSLEPAFDSSFWKLTVTGESGRLILSADSERWDSLRLTADGGESPIPTMEPADAAAGLEMDNGRVLLEQIVALPEKQTNAADWTDLIRVWDILDGVGRSLRRRRTIDLHFETTSERSLFKTRMTAVGCGLLTITLLAVVALLLLGALLDRRDAVEVRAQAAGFIIHRDEFQNASAKPTADGEAHLRRIARKLSTTQAEIVIESSGSEPAELDRRRRRTVIEFLRDDDAPETDGRIVIAELKGTHVQRFMRIARIAVFAPLFLFLLLQALLFVARPSSRDSSGKDSESQRVGTPSGNKVI